MALFLKSKKGGSIPAGIFFAIFLTLFSIFGTVFLAVGIGNPVNKVTHSLWSNQTFKKDAGTYFVSKALETATGDERKLLLQKGPEISTTVTAFLGNPLFHTEIDQLSNEVYAYYSSGSKSNQTIDVSPVAHLGLLGLESVDPQFSKLKKELDKIKPLKLKPQKSGPSASQIKSDFKLGMFLLLLLTLLSILIYLIFAKSLKGALRTLGITLLNDGVLLGVIYEVTLAVIKHQASTANESLAREAIPIAVHPLLNPFITFSILELVIGAVLLGLSFLKRMNVNRQS